MTNDWMRRILDEKFKHVGKRVRVKNLTRGDSTSCGCERLNRLRAATTRHGMSGKSLYKAWQHMIERCENPNNQKYFRYGERGIRVCDEWHDFIIFRDWALDNEYEEGRSIDRINNNGDYTPDNCRWADALIQANNRSTNHYIEYCGKLETISTWARLFGVSYSTLHSRISRGDMRDFEEYFGT